MTKPNPETLVLWRDDAVLAAAKPAGWETFAPQGGPRCLSSLLRRGLGESKLAPVHRLDRDTTGVQLFALAPEAKKALEQAFRTRAVRKAYLALCLRAPKEAQGIVRARLSPWKKGRRPVRVVERGGQEAETAYRVLERADAEGAGAGLPASLLLFFPRHGRTHQIRVHAAFLGAPILGDDQYGDRETNRRIRDVAGLRRQALHAWRLIAPHPVTGETLRLEAPPPPDLAGTMERLFPGSTERLRALDRDRLDSDIAMGGRGGR